MQLLSTVALCTLLVAAIQCESEPLISSSLYKDGHHDFVQQFHHGQPHGSEVVSNSGGVTHLVPNSQIQDQSGVQDQGSHPSVGHVGHVGHGHVSQIGQVGQVPSVSPVGPIAPISPIPGHGGPIIPVPYFGQKSDVPLHAGARAIGAPVPVPYYPYLGRTYASPVYGQYQPAVPHQGVYQHQVYPYSVTPYSAVPYSAAPTSVYPGYPGYNYQYYPQYFPGIPYYQQQSSELQSVSKQ